MNPAEVHLALGWPPGIVLAGLATVVAVVLERRARRGRAGMQLRAVIVALVGLAVARPLLMVGREGIRTIVVHPALPGDARSASAGDRAPSIALPGIQYGGEDASDLTVALDQARAAVGEGGRIVVVGGGAAPGDDPEASAARARAAGFRVDAVLTATEGPDAAVVEIDAPAAWRVGSPVPVGVAVRATGALTAGLAIEVDGREVEQLAIEVPPGGAQATVRTEIDPGDAAWVSLAAEVRADGDIEARNDRFETVVAMADPPTTLVVGRDEGAIMLAEMLSERGGRVVTVDPSRLGSRLSRLEPYDVIALVDVSAESLGLDQMQALEAFVARMGRGVLLTAGRQSFGAGGWDATPLAAIAPVELEPPERDAREAVAFLLMIDQSASMGTVEGRGALSKLDLAREAAASSMEVLHPGDTVGVVAYDEQPRWIVPLRPIRDAADLAEVDAALRGLSSGGGTRLAPALELGLPALASVEAPTRHAVLVSDGRDFAPDVRGLEEAVRAARGAGVSLSAIAVGFDADLALLQDLARIGRGRFHQAGEPSELPRLAVEESEILRSRSEQTGAFTAQLADGPTHPVLRGLETARTPEITGYVAVRPRGAAETALVSPAGDPLLATWGYGLGRVAAWLSDAGEDWAWAWPTDPEARMLFARLIDYLAPAPAAGPPGVAVREGRDRALVEADARDGQGRVIDLADVSLAVTRTGETSSVAMPQVAPGLYARDVALPEGASIGSVVVRSEIGDQTAVTRLVPRPGAPYRPSAAGKARIAALAEVGGGGVLAGLPDAPRRARQIPLWPWLLLAAAMLWPMDVAEQLGYRFPRRHVQDERTSARWTA